MNARVDFGPILEKKKCALGTTSGDKIRSRGDFGLTFWRSRSEQIRSRREICALGARHARSGRQMRARVRLWGRENACSGLLRDNKNALSGQLQNDFLAFSERTNTFSGRKLRARAENCTLGATKCALGATLGQENKRPG